MITSIWRNDGKEGVGEDRKCELMKNISAQGASRLDYEGRSTHNPR